jgi:DNA-binding NarL/FixJ family response regulator
MGADGKARSRQPCVLVVEDHPLMRERLREVIEQALGLIVCGEAEDQRQALRVFLHTNPDLVLLDLTLRASHGLDLIKELVRHRPEVRVLVLSMHDESLHAERSIRAGAHGYISKQEPTRNLIKALRTVLSGKIYLSRQAMERVTGKIARVRRRRCGLYADMLTDRELRVFELLGQGAGTRQVAEQLRVSMRTIETYRARIKEKLGLHGAAQLLQHAIRWVQTGRPPEPVKPDSGRADL